MTRDKPITLNRSKQQSSKKFRDTDSKGAGIFLAWKIYYKVTWLNRCKITEDMIGHLQKEGHLIGQDNLVEQYSHEQTTIIACLLFQEQTTFN